jgi:hypothetical protein
MTFEVIKASTNTGRVLEVLGDDFRSYDEAAAFIRGWLVNGPISGKTVLRIREKP